jgi:hypothetical protein
VTLVLAAALVAANLVHSAREWRREVRSGRRRVAFGLNTHGRPGSLPGRQANSGRRVHESAPAYGLSVAVAGVS